MGVVTCCLISTSEKHIMSSSSLTGALSERLHAPATVSWEQLTWETPHSGNLVVQTRYNKTHYEIFFSHSRS